MDGYSSPFAHYRPVPVPLRKSVARSGLWAKLALNPVEIEERVLDARLRTAWRVTRVLAMMQGRLSENERIELAERPHRSMPFLDGASDVVPLLPPPNRQPTYRWLQTIETVASTIGADLLLPTDIPTFSEHLWGFAHPDPAERLWWPSLQELNVYEEMQQIYPTMRLLSKFSTLEVYNRLQAQRLLTKTEIRSLVAMARRESKAVIEYADQDEERSIMILRLQEVQKRARRSLNLREEVNGLKMEAQLRGLTQQDPSSLDGNRIFEAFATAVASPSSIEYDPVPPTDPPTDPPD